MFSRVTIENVLPISLLLNLVFLVAAIYFYKMYQYYKDESKTISDTLYSNLKSYQLYINNLKNKENEN